MSIKVFDSYKSDEGQKPVCDPSHIVFSHHDYVDKMAKQVCFHPKADLSLNITGRFKSVLIHDAFEEATQLRDGERPDSFRIKYYDIYYTTEHSYGKHKTRNRH